ncbi:MAG TPA: hypothetical protein VMW10_01520 [Alphaproteobacteria bacterium]|nr:hypothetical protein [Alphaproteobacteria bacterium]
MNKYIAATILTGIILALSTPSHAKLNCPVITKNHIKPYGRPYGVEFSEKIEDKTYTWKGHIKVEGGINNIESISLPYPPTPNAALECKYTILQHKTSKSGSGKTLKMVLADIEGLQPKPTITVEEAQVAVDSFHNHKSPPPIRRGSITWRLDHPFDILNLRTVETIKLDSQSLSHFTPDGDFGGDQSYIYKLTQSGDDTEYLMELIGHLDAEDIE